MLITSAVLVVLCLYEMSRVSTFTGALVVLVVWILRSPLVTRQTDETAVARRAGQRREEVRQLTHDAITGTRYEVLPSM